MQNEIIILTVTDRSGDTFRHFMRSLDGALAAASLNVKLGRKVVWQFGR